MPAAKKKPTNSAVSKKMFKGPVHAVPCPYCGDTSDFRDQDDCGFETGSVWECENCGKFFEIVTIKEVTIVQTRQYNKDKDGLETF